MPRTYLLTLLILLGASHSPQAASPLPHCSPLASDAGVVPVHAPQDDRAVSQQKQDPKSRAMRLRAAYLKRIAAYITTKAKTDQSQAPYVIAVVGSDAFADAILKLLPNNVINKRKVKVVVLDPTIAATTTKHKHQLLYVGTSVDQAVVARIIKSHAKLATPLISSRPAFAKKGGGVQLFIKDNKVKFEVNRKALTEQGMKASPQLLKLSTRGPLK